MTDFKSSNKASKGKKRRPGPTQDWYSEATVYSYHINSYHTLWIWRSGPRDVWNPLNAGINYLFAGKNFLKSTVSFYVGGFAIQKMSSTNWDYLPQIFGNRITTTWVLKKNTHPARESHHPNPFNPFNPPIHMRHSHEKISKKSTSTEVRRQTCKTGTCNTWRLNRGDLWRHRNSNF